MFRRGEHRGERAQRQVAVGRAQVPGVGGRERVRGQVRRAAGGPGRAVHARRPGPDLARSAARSAQEAAERHRGAGETAAAPRGPARRHHRGQRTLQARLNTSAFFSLCFFFSHTVTVSYTGPRTMPYWLFSTCIYNFNVM